MTLRYVEKFENIAGTISYTFSLHGMEAQFEQTLRAPRGIGVGANYAHDHLGYGISPKDPGRIRVRCISVETTEALLEAELDEARAECYRIGLGYLYRLDSDGSTRRRCLARLESMPGWTRTVGQFVHAPLMFDFVQLSDWMATTATTGSQTIDTPLESVTVNNPGNLPVTSVVWRLRNNGTARASRPVLFNTTTGQYMASLRQMLSADQEVYIDTETLAVRWSENDGAGYANDYSNFAGQPLRLNPGDNTIRVLCGRVHGLPWLQSIEDPALDLSWSFNAAYA